MKFKKLTSETELKKDDLLIIQNKEGVVQPYFVKLVKHVNNDETEVEVILNKKKNTWFNLKMYFAGLSWAKDVRVVTI